MNLNKCRFCKSNDQTIRWYSKTYCKNCYQKHYVENNKLKRVCVQCKATESKGSWYRGPTCNKCYHKDLSHTQGRKLSQKYYHLKNLARKRHSICEITKEEYFKLMESDCFYCGINLKQFSGHSLDKIESDKGYILENVLPCCGDCNTIRMNILTVEETKEVINILKKLRNTEKSPWTVHARSNENYKKD